MTATIEPVCLSLRRETSAPPYQSITRFLAGSEWTSLALRGSSTMIRSAPRPVRSEEHTSELQSLTNLVCRLLLEKKKHRTVSYGFADDRYLCVSVEARNELGERYSAWLSFSGPF